ncbi:MAG TPA: hypothetical protein VF815_29000 [Myxococcaceae bacterium]|jgi:hypothetical protein
MTQRVSPSALSVVLVLCLYACSSQPVLDVQPPPQARLQVPFSLGYEQTVAIAETPLRLTFMKMLGDSRCPAGVTCFWAGTADIELKAASGAESTLIRLSTYHREAKEASVFGYRIQLEDVTPHPVSGRQIAPSEYTAHLKVTPLPKN